MTAAMQPVATIIIPHLNQQDALIRCLQSLEVQDFAGGPVEIIVVDNGSRAPLDEVAARFPNVIFCTEPAPGPGLARNKGVGAAKSKRLLFIDADCRAHSAWISSAIAAISRDDSSGICGGDVQIDLIDPAHLTSLEAYESVFAYRQWLYISREGFSGTGNLAMQRAMYDAVGPFAGIGIAEDRDWGQRALALGYVTRYVPEMIVYHPARKNFDELTQKWRRHIAHDLAKHRDSGGSGFAWRLRALAMIASIVPHSLTVLRSARLSGFGNQMRGIAILARIRWFRCAEMLRQVSRSGENVTSQWNR
jgi:glycosyltransferase involved in cell wall biosynthesis